VLSGLLGASPAPYHSMVLRYNSDGTLDTSFGVGGRVVTHFGGDNSVARSLIVQPDGKIVTAGFQHIGQDASLVMARYNADGSLDDTCGSNGAVSLTTPPEAIAETIVIDSSDKLIVGGSAGSPDEDFLLARFLPGGSLDPTFGTAGITMTNFAPIDL